MTNELRLDKVRVDILIISSNPCGPIWKVSVQYPNFWAIHIFFVLDGHGHDRSRKNEVRLDQVRVGLLSDIK